MYASPFTRSLTCLFALAFLAGCTLNPISNIGQPPAAGRVTAQAATAADLPSPAPAETVNSTPASSELPTAAPAASPTDVPAAKPARGTVGVDSAQGVPGQATEQLLRLLNDAGLIVITAFISPYRCDRVLARDLIGPERFVEVYLSTPLGVCEQRDRKDLYRRARTGAVKEFTGISSPYEPPETPALAIDTSRQDVSASVSDMLRIILPVCEGRIKA